jgi:hypothetical protein
MSASRRSATRPCTPHISSGRFAAIVEEAAELALMTG